MTALAPLFPEFALREPWLLVAAAGVLAVFARRSAGPPLRFVPAAFMPAALAPDGAVAAAPLPASWRLRLRRLPDLLEAAGLLLLVVALARPVRRESLPLTRAGIDLALCIDVSSSMRQRDMDPTRTRLEVARDEAIAFVAGRPDDRIGLVTFARHPDVRCPPTLDHAALTELLRRIEPVEADGPEDATGLGLAVARAAKMLETSATKSKVALLLTDGEENVALGQSDDEIAPFAAAQLCASRGVRVDAIVAGAGERVDSTPLRRLTERSRGRFFAARDAGAMAAVLASIDTLERSPLDEPRFRLRDAAAAWLTAALLLFGGGRLLRATAWRVAP
jgi:Ca-activated chloride channel family protein